jgi:hypothetical protein
VRVDDGLTDDVVMSMVSGGGFAPPLYLHSSVRTVAQGSSTRSATTAAGASFVESLRRGLSLGRGSLAAFGSGSSTADATLAFLQHICNDLALPPPRLRHKDALAVVPVPLTRSLDADRRYISVPPNETSDAKWSAWHLIRDRSHRDRLRPLHVSAATQLGLLPTSGIPRLVS